MPCVKSGDRALEGVGSVKTWAWCARPASAERGWAAGLRRVVGRGTLPVSLLALACSSGAGTAPTLTGDAGVISAVDSVTSGGPSGDDSRAPVSGEGSSSGEAPQRSDGASGDVTSGASSEEHDGGAPTTDVPVVTSGTLSGTDTSVPGSSSGRVAFAPVGGGFEQTQVVELSASNGETIHYTLDGSVPTLDSPVYDGPITLGSTAMVRVVIEDAEALAYFAQTYVRLEQDMVDFSSNLPIVVIERHGDAPIDRSSNELRPSSVLVFEPGEEGRSRVLGPATLSRRAGARVRGAYSRSFPQVGYAVETWKAGSDEDEDVAFLGMPPDSDWVLSAPSEIDRALMRNMFVMDLSRSIGRYASRTHFVEVFLVDDEARDSLAASDYLGVYTGMEKIKRGAERVDVTKLRETDASGQALTGGYLFRIDHGERDFTVGAFDFGWVYPDSDEMVLPARAPQFDYMTRYIEEFFDCLYEEDFTHPTTKKHYSEYIDVPAWIDHHLINLLTKNVDGLRISSYFYKERNERLVAGPVWDFDRSLGTPHDGRVVDAEEWSSGDGTDHPTWGFWGDLFADPDFAAAYWSRWDELREGAFSERSLVARVDEYEARLTEARERHFARWTQLPPHGSAAEEVQILRDWLGARLRWVDGQRP